MLSVSLNRLFRSFSCYPNDPLPYVQQHNGYFLPYLKHCQFKLLRSLQTYAKFVFRYTAKAMKAFFFFTLKTMAWYPSQNCVIGCSRNMSIPCVTGGNRCQYSPASCKPCYTPCVMLMGCKEMFYLTMHSTHFIYGYMTSDIL